MKRLIVFLLAGLALEARDYQLTVLDEAGAPTEGARVTALFARKNDPRLASMRNLEGNTDARGIFRFAADDDMCLVRLRAAKPGRYDADVTEKHGLDQIPSETAHTITLPHEVVGQPLCYKDVSLRMAEGRFPAATWVGFDFAAGDVIAPWGRGQVADISLRNEGERTGWTYPPEDIAAFRKDRDHAQLSDIEFEEMYGAFRGRLRIRGETPGAGLVRSAAFWPYCFLKMPPNAPLEGYVAMLELPYATLPPTATKDTDVGYYVRVRTRLGTDGKVLDAHYAKIQGGIRCGYGWVSFRYYYNPTANDRRLVLDTQANLLKPAPGASGPEQTRYVPFEP